MPLWVVGRCSTRAQAMSGLAPQYQTSGGPPRIKSYWGFAHRRGKWTIAKIYRRALNGIPFFIDNEAESPVLIKERQPIASCVFIESTLAENRYLSLAHPNRNEGGLDIKTVSDDSPASMLRVPSSNSATAMACGSVLLRFERQPFHIWDVPRGS